MAILSPQELILTEITLSVPLPLFWSKEEQFYPSVRTSIISLIHSYLHVGFKIITTAAVLLKGRKCGGGTDQATD